MPEQRVSKTPQDKSDVSAIHRETGLAWDVVASTGYMKDIAPATWYCCDVLETPHELDGSCDLVFTGRRAMMWIMDLGAWARVVERLLRPGGRFFLFEGHPLDNVWDREASEFVLRSDGTGYFEEAPAENPGFPSSVIVRNLGNGNRPRMLERCWQPGEVINALTGRGLEYAHFDEYPSLFWNQFERIPETLSSRLPHAYSILMRKPEANGNDERRTS